MSFGQETPAWDPWLTRLGYPGIDFNTVKAVNAQTPPLFAAVSTEDEIASYDAWAEEDQWGYHYASGRLDRTTPKRSFRWSS